MQSIVVFVSDLIISSKVEICARELGFVFINLPSENRFSSIFENEATNGSVSHAKLTNDYLSGRDGALIDFLSSNNPALVIFDLDDRVIPWKDLMTPITSSPATRRIPIIGFGPHVKPATLKVGMQLGAVATYPRSQFISKMSELVLRHARVMDEKGILNTCQDPLSVHAIQGLELFNQGEYFDAHELLEVAWKADPSSGRELYRAILQIGIAYLQIERRNYNSAIKMFLRVRQWISPIPEICRGVDVADLRMNAQLVYDALVALGPDGIAQFDKRLFRPIKFAAKR